MRTWAGSPPAAQGLKFRLPVFQRGTKWCVVIDLGRDEHGKRIRHWYTGYADEAAAERARVDILHGIDHGTHVAPERATVAQFLTAEWLPAIRATVRPGTWASYRLNVDKHIAPSPVGRAQLQKLKVATVNAFYAQLLAGGRCDGQGGLSPKTVRNIHGTLHRALADAYKWDRAKRNVADVADPPRWPRPDMKVWSASQLRAFVDEVRSDRLYAAWLLAATTGMRRGEVLGLRWSDVDLEAQQLSVTQTLSVVNYVVGYSEPKTAKGRRRIDLDTETAGALRAHRARQATERLAMGTGWRDTGLVFTGADGTWVHPQRFSQWFAQHGRRAGLPAIRFHDLRHSWASVALSAGEHPKVVSERLGHADVAITLSTYSHVTGGMHREAAQRVASLILGGA